MKRQVITLGLGLLLIGGLLAYRFGMQGGQNAEVREQMLERVERIDDFGSYEALYVEWFEKHHEIAFQRHHGMGGAAQGSGFDGSAYVDDLFNGMAADARAAGYEDQAVKLEEMRDRTEWADE